MSEQKATGFQSLPRAKPRKNECGKTYTEYDGREGAFKAICTKGKGHSGYHGQRYWA